MTDATTRATAPSSAPQRNRRRLSSHLVNSDVRLRLVVDDALFALVAALAAIGILYWLGNRELGDTMYSAHLSIKETRELLTNGAKIAGAVTFAAVLLFGLWSMVDAHRIAGPMHRLHRLLQEIASGDLRHEIRFRRRDEFQEIASAADDLVDAYAARLRSARADANAIARALDSSGLDAAAHAELRSRAASLSEALAYFQLPDSGAAPTTDGSAPR